MKRYERQLMLSQIGQDGQEKLSKSSVLIVGVGGLGCVSATYLASAGIGKIGLADHDSIEISNLNRQICYNESNIGRNKAECAAEYIHRLNSNISVETMPFQINSDNANKILGQYDIIVDGTDNYETRFVVSDICSSYHKPFVFGAVRGFVGQVSVLCCGKYTYRDFMPEENSVCHSLDDKAIIGPTAGIVGCTQASEVIKLITMNDTVLIDKLWLIDLMTCKTDIINL